MKHWIHDKAKAKEYGNYLMGVGVGLIIGSIASYGDKFPVFIVAFGVLFMILGGAIYFWRTRR